MNSSYFDTYLRLKNPSGVVVAYDDDGNGGTNSRIVYALASSGTFTIVATSYAPGATGSYSVSLSAGGGGPVTLINEGAEAGAPGWTFQTVSGLSWLIWQGSDAHSGSRKFATGWDSSEQYLNNTDVRLVSPSFSLAGRSTATLTFYYKHLTEANYDFLRVEVSTDGGSSWTQVWTQSGVSPGWTGWAPQASVSLSSFVGYSNVKVRFRFTSDGNVVSWGADVDDIVVTAQ
jgi:hypothetical protein